MTPKKIIAYRNNGREVEIVDDRNFSVKLNQLNDNILLVIIENSFIYNFTKFIKIDLLVDAIKEYENKYHKIDKILFDFDEIIVDESGIDEISKILNKKCYYICFDLTQKVNDTTLFYPKVLKHQLEFLLINNFMSGKQFLQNMNYHYKDFLKPHKLIFNSNNINPVRIEIFNILKSTNNLLDNIWSFNNFVQFYSDKNGNLNQFLEENKDLIPYSHDNFFEKFPSLKFTYITQYLAYFEIFTESYFFNEITNINECCPVTEKMVKPIVSSLPFIVFASPNLKSTLMEIGLTFNCPLYGFYDITNNESIELGLIHVREQSSKDKRELHEIYYDYFDELNENREVFLRYFKETEITLYEKLNYSKN
jgi:hypothetical protein